MNKKEYLKPTTRVVMLQNKCQILAGSLVEATRDDYGLANDVIDNGLLDGDGNWIWN